MQKSERKNFIDGFRSLRNSKPIQVLNRIFESPIGLAFFATLTLLSFIFALELIFYGIVIVYALYVCLFADDFFTLLPLFLFCYVSPAPKNNPGKAESSIFYGTGGIIILVFAGIAVLSIFLRIGLDKNMGFKRLFTQKRALLWGFLALGLAYMLSGIGSQHYLQIVGKNLLFSALQFLSLFLLYFLFSGTTDWAKKDKKYLAWAILFFGILVSSELLCIYLTNKIIVDGSIIRQRIYTGWGMYNNIGGMIDLSIPFTMYLCTQYKRKGVLFLPLAILLMLATFFSCSRGSIIGGCIALFISYIVAAIKAPKKQPFFILSALLLVCAVLVAILCSEYIKTLFSNVPDIMISEGQSCNQSFWEFLAQFNDSNRFTIYEEGWKVFLKNPVFGDSFYPSDYTPWDFSDVDKFSGFFPPRWHNTFIQILVSCGSVGMIAYLFHRVQTVILFFKRPDTTKTFFGLGILTLLLMSMLDCHMFNIGPAFFYSICLMYAENASKCQAQACLPLSSSSPLSAKGKKRRNKKVKNA